jgi:hypothetical protein
MTPRQRLRILVSASEWLVGDVIALAAVLYMVLVGVAIAVTPWAFPRCTFGECHDDTIFIFLLWANWTVAFALVTLIPLTRSMLLRLGDAVVGRVHSRKYTLSPVRRRPFNVPELFIPDREHWIRISGPQFDALAGRDVMCHVYFARWSGGVLGAESIPDERAERASVGHSGKLTPES